MEKRQEIYVLDKGGQMVYYFNATKRVDDEEQSQLLTASYLTGILQFAKAASGDIISTFELGKLNIMLKQGNLPLYYVFIAGKKTKLKEKKIDKLLTQIIHEFESTHTIEQLNDWDGNLYAFDDFTPAIKKILKVK